MQKLLTRIADDVSTLMRQVLPLWAVGFLALVPPARSAEHRWHLLTWQVLQRSIEVFTQQPQSRR